MNRFLICLPLLGLLATIARAQTPDTLRPDALRSAADLTVERFAQLRTLGRHRVDDFQAYMTVIGDRSRTLAERTASVDLANALFMPDAMAEVLTRTGAVRALPMTQFLKNALSVPPVLIEVSRYSMVLLTDVRRQADGGYSALALNLSRIGNAPSRASISLSAQEARVMRVVEQVVAGAGLWLADIDLVEK